MKKGGAFVISLDFELLWGVQETRTIDSFGKQIEKVHEIIPLLIETFDRYGIKATFASVGALFCNDFEALNNNQPTSTPSYFNNGLNPFDNIELYKKQRAKKYFFAPNLIELIHQEHEVGTHTFSHFYCLEEGQSIQNFEDDLEASMKVAKEKNIILKSIVFPRNQVNNEYLEICKKQGITSYRGTEDSYAYNARSRTNESLIRRGIRLIDTYINITGHHCHSFEYIRAFEPYNIASSRFLRPFSRKLSFLETLKVSRIKKSMTFAAKRGQVYHLWWHPHNFSDNTEQNFRNLEAILSHFEELSRKHSFSSKTMETISAELTLPSQDE